MQIYAHARGAGFSPDQATTMTAVALAESGGNSRAHNPTGEDSRGLWQINARAHPDLARRYDLYDPAQNARAAFEVSRQGSDISPWTVTHGASARYLSHREAAQAAAHAYGDGTGRGVWTGTAGYGSTAAAGAPSTSASPSTSPSTVPTPPPAGDGTSGAAAPQQDSPLGRFLEAALAQSGDRYVYGAEADGKADPTAFDCSELVQWAADRAGVQVQDGAANQYLQMKAAGAVISPEQAARIPGALLFRFDVEPPGGPGGRGTAHVAISLGNGKTIEAKGSEYGVGEFDVGRRFTHAAYVPGLSDPAGLAAAGTLDLTGAGGGTEVVVQPPVVPVPPPAPPDLGGADTDGDGLTDLKERAEQLDPLTADTDLDTLPDGWEVTQGSNARQADSDSDLLPDNFEFAQGLDPLDPDTDDDGHLDGALTDAWADTDVDGVDDGLERLLGQDPLVADTDSDGFVDGLEYRSGSDASDAASLPLPAEPEPEPMDAPL